MMRKRVARVRKLLTRGASSENAEQARRPLLRDLIYLDFDKVASIVSQLEGGLATEIQESYSKRSESSGGVDLRLIGLERTAGDTRFQLETKSLHHALLVRAEEALIEAGVVFDVNQAYSSNMPTLEELQALLQESPYLRAEGSARLQDYDRIGRLLDGSKRLMDLDKGAKLASVGKADEYFALQAEISVAELDLASIQQARSRRAESKKIMQLKSQLRSLENEVGLQETSESIPGWMIDVFKDVMELVKPKQKNLILQPIEFLEDFKVYCNLKPDCFLDTDPDNLLYAYGTMPNVNLTAFGLITSIPSEYEDSEAESASPNTKVATTINESSPDSDNFFDNLFDSTKFIEDMGRSTEYPSVTIYPLAVYYSIRKPN